MSTPALLPYSPVEPDQPGMIPGLVWAFRFHADGRAEELRIDQPIGDHRDGWLWLHFNLADARACHWLASAADLPASARTLLYSADNHQRLHVEGPCVYGVFTDVVR